MGLISLLMQLLLCDKSAFLKKNSNPDQACWYTGDKIMQTKNNFIWNLFCLKMCCGSVLESQMIFHLFNHLFIQINDTQTQVNVTIIIY